MKNKSFGEFPGSFSCRILFQQIKSIHSTPQVFQTDPKKFKKQKAKRINILYKCKKGNISVSLFEPLAGIEPATY